MKFKRHYATALALVMLAAACSDDPDAAETEDLISVSVSANPPTVRPGRATWSTGYFQAAVYSALLEELGYTVADPAVNEYPNADAYALMAEGTFDFWANGWYSQHYTWHERELDDGTPVGANLVVLGNQLASGALEGLVITKSVADEHGIESLDQINRDAELTALFDHDGDGLGEVFGCPEDWTCDDIIGEMIERNGWSNLEQIKAGYPGMVAASIELVQAEEPAIQYTWSPSGYLTELVPGENVLWLSMGGRDKVLDGTTAGRFDFSDAEPAPFGDACTADPCWVGWEVADIKVTANRAFAESNPVATALFEVVELNIPDIAAQNVLYDNGENTEADVQRHAAEWIAENRDRVDVWLASARAAG